MEQLKAIAVAHQCYKIGLYCAENNVAFYEKCGFKRKEIQMVLYSPEEVCENEIKKRSS
jgi:glucosamine-phosphate N-acetyltransferase